MLVVVIETVAMDDPVAWPSVSLSVTRACFAERINLLFRV